VMVTMVAIFVYFRYRETEDQFPSWYTPVLIVLVFLLGAKGAREYLKCPKSPLTFSYVVLYDIIIHAQTAFYGLYVVASVFGFIGYPFFYSYHLLYLMVASPILQSVVRSVTISIGPLSLTFLLTFIVIYIFTMIYFFYQPERFWNEDLGQNECDTLGRCYIIFVRNGLLSGGGIGDYIAGELGHPPNLNDTPDLLTGTIFDLLFFIIVLILLLNIVFGIIIDNFGALREQANERTKFLETKCFLTLRDREPGEHKRSMWNYLYLMVYLRHHKDKTDYTGPETGISKHMEKENDIGWIPTNHLEGYYSLEEDDKAPTEASLNLPESYSVLKHGSGNY